MSFALEKKCKELDFYIENCRQSIVLIEDNIDNNKFLNEYKTKLNIKEKVIYIDFKNIHNARDLAKQLLEQYKQLFDNTLDVKLPKDDYYAVSEALEFITKTEDKQENIVIWMDNFTDILLLQERDWLFGLLRGEFQHHQNIVHVFTSDSKVKINKIFINQDNPFFRFARIVV
ncbi:hypothetical protein [Sulfurimonas microaerophilic]|uniref:hypothetical protein n=1 Tax=Sulfurimonas microaerophilic TaxID=3058392 RepID=UPI00271550F3|nr:hypothetical protein [Sulfurimonas sp. hsl 1-7]